MVGDGRGALVRRWSRGAMDGRGMGRWELDGAWDAGAGLDGRSAVARSCGQLPSVRELLNSFRIGCGVEALGLPKMIFSLEAGSAETGGSASTP